MTQRSLNVGGLRDEVTGWDSQVITRTCDQANHLTYVAPVVGVGWAEHEYNGLCDRLKQTVDSVTTSYSLDLAGGLTQVLADSACAAPMYIHGDHLGSVSLVTDQAGSVVSQACYYSPIYHLAWG